MCRCVWVLHYGKTQMSCRFVESHTDSGKSCYHSDLNSKRSLWQMSLRWEEFEFVFVSVSVILSWTCDQKGKKTAVGLRGKFRGRRNRSEVSVRLGAGCTESLEHGANLPVTLTQYEELIELFPCVNSIDTCGILQHIAVWNTLSSVCICLKL